MWLPFIWHRVHAIWPFQSNVIYRFFYKRLLFSLSVAIATAIECLPTLTKNTSFNNFITFHLTPSTCYLTISVKSYNFFYKLLICIVCCHSNGSRVSFNLNHSYITKEFYYLCYLTVSIKSYRLIYKILIILLSVAMTTAVELVDSDCWGLELLRKHNYNLSLRGGGRGVHTGPWTITQYFRCLREDLNQFNADPAIPNDCWNLWRSISWSIVSNADDKSRDMKNTAFWWSRAVQMKSWMLSKAVSDMKGKTTIRFKSIKKKKFVGDARSDRKPMEFVKNRVRGTRTTGNKTSGCIVDTLI